MASYPKEDLIPNGSEETFICTAARGCTEGRGTGGVLQAHWAIVKGSTYFSNDDVGLSAGRTTQLVSRGLPYGVNEILREEENMRNQQVHHTLMSDTIEEV